MKNKQSVEAQRFKALRVQLNYTQQSFAGLLGLKGSTADIERGKTKLSGKVVMILLEEFNINPMWLFDKSKEQYLRINTGDVSPKVIILNTESEDSILLVNQKAAAGYPNNIHEAGWYESLPAFNIPLPQYRNATYRGFQVEGDSMLPNIRPNEWVLGRAVSNISDASNGKIYIVVMYDSVLVKKIQKLENPSKMRLHSLNEEYLPIDIFVKDIQEMWQVNSKLSFGIDEDSNAGLLKQLQQSMEDLKAQISALKK